MSASSLAGIITAVATCLIALGGVITAISVLLPILRITRSTHTLVNQKFTDLENHARAMARALTAAGIPVPVDQSLPDPVVDKSSGAPLE
jgi:hypothetical protein